MHRKNSGCHTTRIMILTVWVFMVTVSNVCTLRSEDVGDHAFADGPDYSAYTTVWYASVREKRDDKVGPEIYSAERGELSTGIGVVSFERYPWLGRIADSAAFYIPDEKVKVTDVIEMPGEQFWEDVETFARGKGDIVFYIHGYNTGFEKALRQAAIFQRVLKSRKRVLLFSWPADDDLLKYTHDATNLEWSVPRIARVLCETIQRTGPGKLDVAAHSLGARGVVMALYEISRDSPGERLLNNLVLMAPDIDRDRFRDTWPDVEKMAGRTTLYVSENDKALKISRRVNGYSRLGEGGDYLTVLPGIETIDVSLLNNKRPSGHIYHLYNPYVIEDLATLFYTGQSAGRRANLKKEEMDDIAYWRLMPVEVEKP